MPNEQFFSYIMARSSYIMMSAVYYINAIMLIWISIGLAH